MSEEQLIATPGTFGENGNFLLERELGRGGMGGVYMGRDKMLDRPVAVKVMLKEYGSDPEFVEKFKREAQAAAKLIHPNIAQVYSYGISEGMPYIAMELVAGGSLDGLMQVHGANIDVPRVMKICEQVAQALRCAADKGLVHGDVKPENILLDANGNAKLVDFGLAAMQKDTNEIWGTPYYIAPEKVKKEPVDYRADMYSLGGTIYHALTGVAPFEGDDATAVVKKRFEGAPRKPSEVRPGLSPQIDFLVMKMLALNPQDRYPSFEALLDDYKKVLTTGLSKTQSVAEAASAGAAAGLGGERKSTTSAGGKKLTIKPKKKFTVHRPADEAGQEGANVNVPPPEEGAYEDEEGGVGGKVAMVIGGIILAVVAVAGGLIWMVKSNEAEEERKTIAQIEAGYKGVIENYTTLRHNVSRFRDEVASTSVLLTNDCQSATERIAREMKKLYPADMVARLTPPKPMPRKPKAEGAPADKAAEPAATPAPAAANVERFPPPTDDEADPMSPEHQKYLERKAEWEARQKDKAAAKAAESEEPSGDDEGGAEEGEVLEEPACVGKMAELWLGAWKCVDVCDGLLAKVQALDAAVDAEIAKNPGEKTLAFVESMKKRQDALKEELDSLKALPEWDDVVKFRKSQNRKCEDTVRAASTAIRAIVKRREEVANKRRLEEEKKRREQELEEMRTARIEKETTEAKECYESVIQSYVVHLDWDSAIGELERVKAGFQSGEGRVLADQSIASIESMKTAQEVLRRNIVGWQFKRKEKFSGTPLPQIQGWTVKKLDDRFIFCADKAGKEKRMTWGQLYTEYHANFGQLINTYIRKGNENGSPRLRSSEWSRAMFGAALTLQILCSDDATAAPYKENLVKQAVKTNSAYKDVAARLFPDIDLSEVEAEMESSEL